ncbi:unnamed protein product (macronuclear) [Paramecium tetraurelia]|uniref:Coiled-coil domain-containing protein n=1 Tax=Paramecium tetraurelia TaxID=5888 RepID=A0D8P9_PARTE|nr:uncharacterized protein GSPATT00014362001 [Paramecium tetraurelia]CAK79416.1 unnamed protein product [Paramecium tetraurelia]|eukprot:XP_001446813.1 hypothetical protein (macronuclear) [Paramecium tetraurelia strain d4-2]
MPKKFSINPKAQAAREKEVEKKETAKSKKKQKEEEEYWKETDKNVISKQERQRQKELEEESKRKKQEEKKMLYESEMNAIESRGYIQEAIKGRINVEIESEQSENEEVEQEQLEQQDNNQFLQQNQQEQQINLEKLQEIWDSDKEDFDETIGQNQNHILRDQQKKDKEKYEQIIDADGIDQFIDAIDGKGPQQLKFKEYCRKRLQKVQKDNPLLRHSQIMEMIYKQWKTDPLNPKNQ